VNENDASLYNPTHLAVLRLIGRVVEAGHAAGKWVGMCGEMAGDPSFTEILLGLGLDELSVPAAAVPRIKRLVRETRFSAAKALAAEVLQLSDHDSIQKKLFERKRPS
jgi:phosphotransferase system enzyme I (PtsI)